MTKSEKAFEAWYQSHVTNVGLHTEDKEYARLVWLASEKNAVEVMNDILNKPVVRAEDNYHKPEIL